MKYHTLFFSKIREDVAKFVVCCSRGILPPSAPALPSRVTCQVNESPRTFSDSSSLIDLGNAFLHNSNILGRWPFTTGGPLKTNKKPVIQHLA